MPRLSSMSEESVLRAVLLYISGRVDRVILSTAYGEWESTIERDQKIELLMRHGIPREAIDVIPNVTNSYNEAEGVRKYIEQHGIGTIVLVAERWHRFRAIQTLKILFSNIKIEVVWFKPLRWDMTEEPSTIKTFRSGIPPLWVLWNLLLWIPTPLFARMAMKKPLSQTA